MGFLLSLFRRLLFNVTSSHLVAYGDGRVRERAIPGHADLHADWLGEEVTDSVRDLGHHHREAHRQQEDPEEAPAALSGLVRRRAEAADVHLRIGMCAVGKIAFKSRKRQGHKNTWERLVKSPFFISSSSFPEDEEGLRWGGE